MVDPELNKERHEQIFSMFEKPCMIMPQAAAQAELGVTVATTIPGLIYIQFSILVSYSQTACHHFMHWDSEQTRKSIAQNQRIRCGSFHRLLNKMHYIRFPSRSNLKDCGGFNICLPLPRRVGSKLLHLEKDNSQTQRLKPKSHCWE